MIRLLLILAITLFALPAYAADSAPLDDPGQLVALAMGHKWIALAAVGIGLVVRLLKSDTKIPIDIPPRLRAPLALALGAASGAIDKLVEAGSTTWTAAITSGVLAAVLAMISHTTVIGSMRGGKELDIPGLIKTNTPPGPGKPPSVPPPGMVVSGIALVLAAGALLLGVQACGYGAAACKVVDVVHDNCTWLRYLESDGTERKVQLTQDDAREFGRAVAAKQAAKALDAGAAEGGTK